MLTQEHLKTCLIYNQESGEFTWRRRPVEHFKDQRSCNKWNAQQEGKKAGGPDGHGYCRIVLNARQYPAHRLAWLYMRGSFPVQIDHINGVRNDNRLCNLRDVSSAENKRNQKVQYRNKTGHIGVIPAKTDSKWVAYISCHGHRKHLGTFSSIKDAISARKAAEKKMGFHPNHGKR